MCFLDIDILEVLNIVINYDFFVYGQLELIFKAHVLVAFSFIVNEITELMHNLM